MKQVYLKFKIMKVMAQIFRQSKYYILFIQVAQFLIELQIKQLMEKTMSKEMSQKAKGYFIKRLFALFLLQGKINQDLQLQEIGHKQSLIMNRQYPLCLICLNISTIILRLIWYFFWGILRMIFSARNITQCWTIFSP